MLVLSNKNILITSGSTRGYLDAVRYITNTSTGKLGREIALEAMRHGAFVTYVYGKDSVFPVIENQSGIKTHLLNLIEIETNNDLIRTLQVKLKNKKYDVIIHAMAVVDYVPNRTKSNKTPSEKEEWEIKLVKTPKVINIIRKIWPETYLVGFKLEVNKRKDELIKIARSFMKKRKADLIVANDYKTISNNRHIAYLISNDGNTTGQFKNKKEIAKGIILYLEKMFG